METDLSSRIVDVRSLDDAHAEGRPRGGAVVAFRRLGYLIGVTDVLSILIAFAIAFAIRFHPEPPPPTFLLVMAMVPPLWALVFGAWRLSAVHRFTPAEEFRRVFGAISVVVTIVATGSFWTKAELSRQWIGTSWALSILFVLATRQWWHTHIGRRRVRGELIFRTLIVGTNHEAERLAGVMRGSHAFEPVGFISTGNGIPSVDGVPVVGHVRDVRQRLRDRQADCLFVVASAVSEEEMHALAKVARREGVEMRISANLPPMHSSRVSAQPIAGVLSLALQPVSLSGGQAALKRTFDVVLSALGLVLLSPLFLAIAIAVLTTGRPILYRQERVGRHGQAFTLLKFRTMVNGAEAMIEDLRDRNEADGPLFKIRDDPRATRVGRFLRRWSLDELPQLWNVLRGDMSLVGPRPPLPREVDRYEEWHFDRLEVRPGITGLWQSSGRSSLTFDDYVRLDLFYIENWSLAYDLFILLKTFPAMWSGRGSY